MKHTNTIYLDIETIPSQEKWVRKDIEDNIEPPKALKKQSSIDEWHKTKKKYAIEEAMQKLGFMGETSHIVSLGLAINNEPATVYQLESIDKEKSNLRKFFEHIGKIEYPTFVGHNIVSFDLRIIRQRSVVLGVQPPANILSAFAAKPWDDVAVYDTMIQWNADKGNMISQDKLAKCLGYEGKKGMSGKDVYPAWQKGEFDKIGEYCMDDVETVRKIYKAMTFQGNMVRITGGRHDGFIGNSRQSAKT